MGRTVSIIQSNYLPWKGYFDIIHDSEIFVFLDNVEYSKNSWRNRNKIKTPRGLEWITVPLVGKGLNHQLIQEVLISGSEWQETHLAKIRDNYREAPYFDDYEQLLEEFFLKRSWTNLSEMNHFMIKSLSLELGIKSTEFVDARALQGMGIKDDRVISICKELGADRYISGPSAKNYISEEKFERAGIALEWKTYSYPEYPQLHPPFAHETSVVDLLMTTGPNAGKFIWGEE